ncbi:autotransporter [Pollutimonas subterranea]|uniref:Autotransporter n=1 Tax=Pollutimonas subterranea TaxID=2045210 RepID=A0A2N4UA16_9BURK|nr:autotransporter outer membrane beta-barrel domain-containing protein [Pollutimonas subterranea]PLC51838.1 autotransporter [Pollutimonas subterranea]
MKTIAPFALVLLLGASPSSAIEYRSIENPAGRIVFEARFFDVEDGPYIEEGDESQESVWAWQPHLQEQIVTGLKYWAEVIQPMGDSAQPTIVNIGTDDTPGNAFGGSPLENGDAGTKTLLQQSLQGLPVDEDDLNVGAHGYFGLGPSGYPITSALTQIPLSGKDDLVSTAIHELAHGLGILGGADDAEGPFTPQFADVLTGMAPLMVDDNGNPARPNQAILCEGCDNAYDPAAFDVRSDRGILVGPNILEALDGGLPGVPVTMLYEVGGETGVDNNNMSHLELNNSTMSHQNYRSYTAFTEAELAVLQDIGYTIDRRNFFGRSVYGSGLDIVNDRGFFARNAEGTQYLHGQYNRASLGLGLHVYGSHNRIRQVGDLLAAGAGGAGIRVDGEGNTLIIDPGVRVHANGLDGQGVMFAYGKDHVLVQRGDVEAQGTRGVGLRFDFGDNGLSNEVESRGSYIRTLHGQPFDLLPELQGPLVRQADISGRVAGREAAIYISANAHVGSINLMQGARVDGDIVSRYAERDAAGDLRLTTVSFGQRADEQGRATGVADSDFRFAYAGNISGKDNLTLSFEGGETRLSGMHQVHGAAVRDGATLSGTSTFGMAPGTRFSNHGTLAPGNSIGRMTVDGDYAQTSSGRLAAEFMASGAHDVVAVSGTADLAGTLQLTPMADWYSSAWTVQTGSVVDAAVQRGEFGIVAFASTSPTLDFSATALGGQRYLLEAHRAADAYSQYGQDDNERAAGQALQQVAGHAPSDAQSFFRTLDFSAPDGSEVGRSLSLVSPAGYSAGFAASLQRERDVMDTALRGFGEGLGNSGSDWKGFAVAFGGEGRQDARDSIVGYDASTYGVVIGGGRRLNAQPDTFVGVHLDIADQSVRLKAPQWGKGESTAFGLGAQVRYQPDAFAGPYAYGGVRFGIEEGSMDRHVAVGDYYAAHSADWTGHSASVQAGGGYRWRLSPTLSAGPFASLNYARVSRPGVDESGAAATRLYLDSQRIDALRSSIGMGASMMLPLQSQGEVRAHAQASWEHEWLNRNVTQTARFAAWPAAAFESTNAVLPRDSLALRVGVDWKRSERFSTGIDLGGRLGNGYKALEGQLSMRWRF